LHKALHIRNVSGEWELFSPRTNCQFRRQRFLRRWPSTIAGGGIIPIAAGSGTGVVEFFDFNTGDAELRGYIRQYIYAILFYSTVLQLL
jgi:hypothetical protein